MSGSAQTDIASRLSRLRQEIAQTATEHHRDPSAIRLIAVSKTRSLQEVEQAVAAGHQDFGENTVQDAMTKIPSLTSASWHFIGHLQSNKCKQVAGQFDWIHSIDSSALLDKLQAALELRDARIACLLQVNLSGEASKHGLAATEVLPLIEASLEKAHDRISLRGLMTIGVAKDIDSTRAVFASCRGLLHDVQDRTGLRDFDQLSMGMSGDYREAIAEGATMLRLGTAIFGARDYSDR